jgi:hypothetical protein
MPLASKYLAAATSSSQVCDIRRLDSEGITQATAWIPREVFDVRRAGRSVFMRSDWLAAFDAAEVYSH